jgi:hypothetical protein
MTSIKEILFQLPIDLERMIYEFAQDKEQMDKVLKELLNKKLTLYCCECFTAIKTYNFFRHKKIFGTNKITYIYMDCDYPLDECDSENKITYSHIDCDCPLEE